MTDQTSGTPGQADDDLDVVEGVAVDAPTTKVREDGFRVTRSVAGWVVDVAVPLVVDAVALGSRLDEAARSRPWSRGPDLDGLARERSFDLGTRRRAVVTTVEVARDGRVLGTRVRVATFACLATLNQRQASSVAEDPGSPLHEPLEAAREAARAYDAGRGRRGNGGEFVRPLIELANASLAAAFEASGHPLLYAVGGWDLRRTETSARPGASHVANGGSYANFTSPLRRYVDLVNQRILVDALLGRAPCYDEATLEALAREVDDARSAGRQRRGD